MQTVYNPSSQAIRMIAALTMLATFVACSSRDSAEWTLGATPALETEKVVAVVLMHLTSQDFEWTVSPSSPDIRRAWGNESLFRRLHAIGSQPPVWLVVEGLAKLHHQSKSKLEEEFNARLFESEEEIQAAFLASQKSVIEFVSVYWQNDIQLLSIRPEQYRLTDSNEFAGSGSPTSNQIEQRRGEFGFFVIRRHANSQPYSLSLDSILID